MLYLQIFIALSSVVANLLGIHCLRKQKTGSKNQSILHQNLSLIDVVKILYDFIPLGIYYSENDFYVKNYIYFDVVEIYMMTTIYSSYILLLVDRLAGILLDIRYSWYFTTRSVKLMVISSWITGLPSGLFVVFSESPLAKVYYYISCDAIIIVSTIFTYSVIIGVIQRINNRQFPSSQLRNKDVFGEIGSKRSLLVTFLLLTSFIVCWVIPDIIFLVFKNNVVTYRVISLLWTTGFLLDPIIYICVNKELRRITFNMCTKLKWKLAVKLEKLHWVTVNLTSGETVEEDTVRTTEV